MAPKNAGIGDEYSINIYTDGSCKPNLQRNGGVGFCYITVDEIGDERIDDKQSPAGWLKATNQQMELMACILALEQVTLVYKDFSDYRKIIVFTDSKYVEKHYNTALYSWSKKQKWIKVSGAPVENVELWKKLLKSVKKAPLQVVFEFVKGHGVSKYNNIADELATKSAINAIHPPLIEIDVAPRLSANPTKVGSVGVHGQEIDIRIVGRKPMPHGNTYQYRYSVIEKESPYFGMTDFVYFDQYLHRHATVHVLLNKNQSYPQIVEVLSEVANT